MQPTLHTQFLTGPDAQLLTYLRMSGCKVGLLLNFNAPRLKDGLRRIIHSQNEAAGDVSL